MSSFEEDVEFDADADYPPRIRNAPPPSPSTAPRSSKVMTQETATNSTTTTTMFHQPVDYRHQMSMPSHHHDPFSVRTGKTLVWKNINMTLVSKQATQHPSRSFVERRQEVVTLTPNYSNNRLQRKKVIPTANFLRMLGERSQVQ
jgi:hypothetical protein